MGRPKKIIDNEDNNKEETLKKTLDETQKELDRIKSANKIKEMEEKVREQQIEVERLKKYEESNKLEESLKRLREIEPSIEKKLEEPKEKKEKTLFQRLFNSAKLKQPKKVAVIYLRENGNAQALELEPDKNGFFNFEDKVYHEDSDCMYTIITRDKERVPLAIIPEWNLTPLGNRNWTDKDMQERFATLQDHAMKGIRHAERVRMGESESGKLNIKAIVLIVLIIVIVGAILWGLK